LDLRYTTVNNVAGKVIASPQPMLQPAVAKALQGAARVFKSKGYQVVVWDAYRTSQTQETLLSITHDQKYVREDSNHPKGLAVDMTLADKDGKYLDMGTDFDDFSPRAHVDTTDITPIQQQNRQMLIEVMQEHGFTVWPYEWWHFDFTGSK
jgi:D-alanyl-D-alanine dipeptidase